MDAVDAQGEKIGPQLSTRVFSSTELADHIYKGQSLPQDPRFRSTENGGVFEYFDLGNLDDLGAQSLIFPALEVDGTIVGLSELQYKPGTTDTAWIKFISVDPAFRGKGYGSRLAEGIFRFAKEKGLELETSSYSREGYDKLKNLFVRYSSELGVKFTDTDRNIE